MKKTLLLFAMLLGVVGAWAQRTMPTISDEPQNGEWAENTTWYTLKTKNGYYYKTDLSLNTSSKPTAADIAGNHKYQWCITGNETVGYKLYNRYQGAGQFLGSNNINGGTSNCYFTSEVQDKITTFKFRESTHGDAWWCLQLNGNTAEAYLARNGSGGHLIAWCTGYNTAKGDGGAPITFEEVEDLPEISLTNVQPNDDQLTLYIDATTQTLTFSMDSPKELGAKAKFAYVLHDGKYTFYNEASKSFLIWRGNTSGGFNGNKGTLSDYNATYCDWEYTKYNEKGFYFRAKRNDTSKYGSLVLLTTSTTTPKSYAFDAYEVGAAWQEGNKQFSNLFTVLINCNLYNEALGSTFQLTHSTPDIGVKPTINVEGVTLSDELFNGGSEYSAKVAFPFPVSSETVANPTMISSYNYSSQAADQFKWYASDNKIKVKEEEEIFSSSIASHLWLIYPIFNNGAFTFQIKNVATGLFINSSVEDTGHDDQSTVKLSDAATAFTIGVRNGEGHEFINSFGKWLSVNTSTPNGRIQTVGTHGSSHNGTALTFPEPEFNVTIGSTGYATLYSPITVIQDLEQRLNPQTLVEIYQIKDEPQNGSLTLSPENYVLKNQGVILKGNPGTYRFAIVGEDWTEYINPGDWINKNKLSGSFTNTYVQGDAYVLSAPEGVESVGLYKALLNKDANGEAGNTHFKNNAGKAYLPASALSAEAAESRFFLFGFGDGEETGITETENGNVKTENTEVYDLSGRRVQGAQKGIFIVNGKKVVR